MTTTVFTSDDALTDATYSAGDIILLTRGSSWDNEQLVIRGTGTEANPILVGTTGSGALPVIGNVRAEISVWTDEGSNLWSFPLTYAGLSSVLQDVWLGGVHAKRIANTTAPSTDLECSFYIGTDKVYVYSVGNPTSYYGPTHYYEHINDHAGILVYASHIQIEEIRIEKSGVGVHIPPVSGNVSNVTIQGMEYDGVSYGEFVEPLYDTGNNSVDGLYLYDSVATDCGNCGVQIQRNTSLFEVGRMTVNSSGLFQSSSGIGTGFGLAAHTAKNENTRNGDVFDCSVTDQKYGRYFTGDGACYYIDQQGHSIRYKRNIGKDSEGQLFHCNSGYDGNSFTSGIGDNVASVSTSALFQTDSINIGEVGLEVSNCTLINIPVTADVFQIANTGSGSGTVTYKNNISIGGRYGLNYLSASVDRGDILDSYNDFYDVDNVPIYDGSSPGTAGTGTITTDPGLTGYTPDTSSNVYHAGTYAGIGRKDYNEYPFPLNAPSMGAIEVDASRSASSSRTSASTRSSASDRSARL
jgi:hypothetical protein